MSLKGLFCINKYTTLMGYQAEPCPAEEFLKLFKIILDEYAP